MILYRHKFLYLVSAGLFSAITMLGADAASASTVDVEKGSAAFELPTNMPGIQVKGKSSMLSGAAVVRRDAEALVFERVKASFPVSSLTTGMKVRDEHMRKYIFETTTGEQPDVQFVSDKITCAAHGSRGLECDAAGVLTIRGKSGPLAMKLQVKEQGSSAAEYRAVGNGILKLTDYGIEPPSQLGVKTSNEVKLHLEFTGRQKVLTAYRTEAPR